MVSSHVPRLDAGAAADADEAGLVESYRTLVRARALEARWTELEQRGAILPRRLGRGEEVSVAAAVFALGANKENWLLGDGTELLLPLLRGATLADFVGHAFGRGPNPWNLRERQTLACDLRNGAHVTHGVGIAWAAKIERRDTVVLVTFTEEALTTGEFHNGINFAGVFKVPAIFLCRHRLEPSSSHDSAGLGRAEAYGITSAVCDGADFFAVADAVRQARQRAAAGQGPTLIDARIGPQHEQSMAAPQGLAALRRHLDARGLFNAEQEARIESAANAEIDRAADSGSGSPAGGGSPAAGGSSANSGERA